MPRYYQIGVSLLNKEQIYYLRSAQHHPSPAPGNPSLWPSFTLTESWNCRFGVRPDLYWITFFTKFLDSPPQNLLLTCSLSAGDQFSIQTFRVLRKASLTNILGHILQNIFMKQRLNMLWIRVSDGGSCHLKYFIERIFDVIMAGRLKNFAPGCFARELGIIPSVICFW